MYGYDVEARNEIIKRRQVKRRIQRSAKKEVLISVVVAILGLIFGFFLLFHNTFNYDSSLYVHWIDGTPIPPSGYEWECISIVAEKGETVEQNAKWMIEYFNMGDYIEVNEYIRYFKQLNKIIDCRGEYKSGKSYIWPYLIPSDAIDTNNDLEETVKENQSNDWFSFLVQKSQESHQKD